MRVGNPQRAVTLQAACDEKTPVTRRFPDTFDPKPAVNEDMGLCIGHGVKFTDRRFHHVYFALKRYPFARAHSLLTIHLGQQRTAPPQQHIQTLHQTVSGDAAIMTGRVMRTQSGHLFTLRLILRRVVPNQITCDDGFPGASLPFWALATLARVFLLDRFAQLFMKALRPGSRDFSCRPRRSTHETRQTTDALSVCHLAQQSAQRVRFLAQHQRQQYGHQVLILGLAQALAKRLAKLAQPRIQTDNRDRHRVSPWLGWCEQPILYHLKRGVSIP